MSLFSWFSTDVKNAYSFQPNPINKNSPIAPLPRTNPPSLESVLITVLQSMDDSEQARALLHIIDKLTKCKNNPFQKLRVYETLRKSLGNPPDGTERTTARSYIILACKCSLFEPQVGGNPAAGDQRKCFDEWQNFFDELFNSKFSDDVIFNLLRRISRISGNEVIAPDLKALIEACENPYTLANLLTENVAGANIKQRYEKVSRMLSQSLPSLASPSSASKKTTVAVRVEVPKEDFIMPRIDAKLKALVLDGLDMPSTVLGFIKSLSEVFKAVRVEYGKDLYRYCRNQGKFQEVQQGIISLEEHLECLTFYKSLQQKENTYRGSLDRLLVQAGKEDIKPFFDECQQYKTYRLPFIFSIQDLQAYDIYLSTMQNLISVFGGTEQQKLQLFRDIVNAQRFFLTRLLGSAGNGFYITQDIIKSLPRSDQLPLSDAIALAGGLAKVIKAELIIRGQKSLSKVAETYGLRGPVSEAGKVNEDEINKAIDNLKEFDSKKAHYRNRLQELNERLSNKTKVLTIIEANFSQGLRESCDKILKDIEDLKHGIAENNFIKDFAGGEKTYTKEFLAGLNREVAKVELADAHLTQAVDEILPEAKKELQHIDQKGLGVCLRSHELLKEYASVSAAEVDPNSKCSADSVSSDEHCKEKQTVTFAAKLDALIPTGDLESLRAIHDLAASGKPLTTENVFAICSRLEFLKQRSVDPNSPLRLYAGLLEAILLAQNTIEKESKFFAGIGDITHDINNISNILQHLVIEEVPYAREIGDLYKNRQPYNTNNVGDLRSMSSAISTITRKKREEVENRRRELLARFKPLTERAVRLNELYAKVVDLCNQAGIRAQAIDYNVTCTLDEINCELDNHTYLEWTRKDGFLEKAEQEIQKLQSLINSICTNAGGLKEKADKALAAKMEEFKELKDKVQDEYPRPIIEQAQELLARMRNDFIPYKPAERVSSVKTSVNRLLETGLHLDLNVEDTRGREVVMTCASEMAKVKVESEVCTALCSIVPQDLSLIEQQMTSQESALAERAKQVNVSFDEFLGADNPLTLQSAKLLRSTVWSLFCKRSTDRSLVDIQLPGVDQKITFLVGQKVQKSIQSLNNARIIFKNDIEKLCALLFLILDVIPQSEVPDLVSRKTLIMTAKDELFRLIDTQQGDTEHGRKELLANFINDKVNKALDGLCGKRPESSASPAPDKSKAAIEFNQAIQEFSTKPISDESVKCLCDAIKKARESGIKNVAFSIKQTLVGKVAESTIGEAAQIRLRSDLIQLCSSWDQLFDLLQKDLFEHNLVPEDQLESTERQLNEAITQIREVEGRLFANSTITEEAILGFYRAIIKIVDRELLLDIARLENAELVSHSKRYQEKQEITAKKQFCKAVRDLLNQFAATALSDASIRTLREGIEKAIADCVDMVTATASKVRMTIFQNVSETIDDKFKRSLEFLSVLPSSTDLWDIQADIQRLSDLWVQLLNTIKDSFTLPKDFREYIDAVERAINENCIELRSKQSITKTDIESFEKNITSIISDVVSIVRGYQGQQHISEMENLKTILRREMHQRFNSVLLASDELSIDFSGRMHNAVECELKDAESSVQNNLGNDGSYIVRMYLGEKGKNIFTLLISGLNDQNTAVANRIIDDCQKEIMKIRNTYKAEYMKFMDLLKQDEEKLNGLQNQEPYKLKRALIDIHKIHEQGLAQLRSNYGQMLMNSLQTTQRSLIGLRANIDKSDLVLAHYETKIRDQKDIDSTVITCKELEKTSAQIDILQGTELRSNFAALASSIQPSPLQNATQDISVSGELWYRENLPYDRYKFLIIEGYDREGKEIPQERVLAMAKEKTKFDMTSPQIGQGGMPRIVLVRAQKSSEPGEKHFEWLVYDNSTSSLKLLPTDLVPVSEEEYTSLRHEFMQECSAWKERHNPWLPVPQDLVITIGSEQNHIYKGLLQAAGCKEITYSSLIALRSNMWSKAVPEGEAGNDVDAADGSFALSIDVRGTARGTANFPDNHLADMASAFVQNPQEAAAALMRGLSILCKQAAAGAQQEQLLLPAPSGVADHQPPPSPEGDAAPR